MRALPALPGRVVIAALERAGFKVIRTKGSHYFLRHQDDPSRQTVVPVHRNDLPTGTLRAYCAKPASAARSSSTCSERTVGAGQASSASSALASFRSVVSRPSVNEP